MKTPPRLDPERETRLFFWFLTLVLIAMYIIVLVDQPQIRHPLRLVIFTVLFGIHLALHWILRVRADRPGWSLKYLLVQGALACVIGILSRHLGMIFGLFMALVGEAIGVYGVTRRGFAIAAYYMALSLASYVLIFGTTTLIWWMLGTMPVVLFVVIYVELYSRQMNANIRAQELLLELQAANQQLTEYANQVEDLTIANERQRMARELHDTLSQGLAGLILQLEAVDAHLGGGRPEKARTITQQAMESARGILAASRRAIDDLRRAAPDDLETALRQDAARFHKATGIPCDVNIALPAALLADLYEPILRIVAEALTNIARHAQASQASVSVEAADGELHLAIRDDGRGFDPAAVPPGHYGLVGMGERVRLAGGTLDIESALGKGTESLDFYTVGEICSLGQRMRNESPAPNSLSLLPAPWPPAGDLILSPMDGYSDLPFRSICRELGSAISYTEFINALDILQGHPYIHEKLAYLPSERPVVYQIFDNDPDRLLEAALRLLPPGLADYPGAQMGQPDIIDINLGCSAKSVSSRGAGAGLLKTPAKIAEIFRKLTHILPVPVTAKIRLGWDDSSRNYLEVAKILEDNGAAAIAVHGRTRQQGYRGEADWDAIAEVCQAVSVPVFANGDVRTVADIERLKAHTGCPAVMIGRGAIGNPWIFARLDRENVPPDGVRATLLAHLERMLAFHGERGLILFRKHAERYLKPYNLSPDLRQRIFTIPTADEFRQLVDEVIMNGTQ